MDYVPAVAGEVGLMDNERADGPLAGGLLEFVGPTAIVGKSFACKEVGIVGRRIADDAQDDLALDVFACVVVPLELGRGDAVADEDDGGVEGGGGGEEVWLETTKSSPNLRRTGWPVVGIRVKVVASGWTFMPTKLTCWR